MSKLEYKVRAYAPKVKGCGATDLGWTPDRCEDFELFLNTHSASGWRFHSSEYRHVVGKGCGGQGGTWLVCIFERTAS